MLKCWNIKFGNINLKQNQKYYVVGKQNYLIRRVRLLLWNIHYFLNLNSNFDKIFEPDVDNKS